MTLQSQFTSQGELSAFLPDFDSQSTAGNPAPEAVVTRPDHQESLLPSCGSVGEFLRVIRETDSR